MSDNELFPIVDSEGNVIGKASRRQCHGGSMLLHPVVHLHIFSRDSKIYLQKRSIFKDIQPGKWDTAVGGHVDYGEDILTALKREAREELGIELHSPKKLMSYIFESEREREFVNVFYIVVEPRHFNPCLDTNEISDGRFWSLTEVEESIGKNRLTPNFEQEFRRILPHIEL